MEWLFTRPMVWDMIFFVMGAVCVWAFYYRFIGYEEMRWMQKSKTGFLHELAYLKRMYRYLLRYSG